MRISALVRTALLLALASRTAFAQDKIYWTDTAQPPGTCKVWRADLDGSNGEILVDGLPELRGIAIDAVAGRVYWTESIPTPKIRSSKLDGTDLRDVVPVTDSTAGVAVDSFGGKLYWTEAGYNSQTPKIQRVDLDGINIQNLAIPGLVHPVGIAVDPASGRIYWSDIGTQQIRRANLDGSGDEVVILDTQGDVNGLTLDLVSGHLYWCVIPQPQSEWFHGTVRRANLDGSSQEILFSGQTTPTTVAVDHTNGKVYWSNSWHEQNPGIMRGDMDGTNPEVVVTNLGQPFGIVIGPAFVPPPPNTYCTAKVNSLGCTPAISFTGLPTLSGLDDFYITATNVLNNKTGMLLLSKTSGSTPFYGGTLCLGTPFVRTAIQNSHGNAGPPDCSGSYSFHFTQAYMRSRGLVPGSDVHAQFWSRDPGYPQPNKIGLTDGVHFTIGK